jgi:hypothetical protein
MKTKKTSQVIIEHFQKTNPCIVVFKFQTEATGYSLHAKKVFGKYKKRLNRQTIEQHN